MTNQPSIVQIFIEDSQLPAMLQQAAVLAQAIANGVSTLSSVQQRELVKILQFTANLSPVSEDAPDASITGVPPIDYDSLIEVANSRYKWVQGSPRCVAFARGAEWFREQVSEAAQPPAGPAIHYTPGTWFEAKTHDELQAFFLSRLPAIREAARECGYAIGLHGSLRRDLDLIATPWSDGAAGKDELAHAIANAACGLTRAGDYEWEAKPLGRMATSIPCCWPTWHGVSGLGHIDLSVVQAAAPALVPPITWPKARDIGRLQDMGEGHLRVMFDSDNDVVVEVFNGKGSAAVEFVNPGGGGGGQSRHTRLALIALMVAMEADNAEKPSRDFWALRGGLTVGDGRGGNGVS